MTKDSTIAGARIIIGKELTQIANRRAFHLEKAAFAAVTTAIFLVAASKFTMDWTIDPETMGRFGRGVFLTVSVGACLILSLVALVTATGIVLSESLRRRLDILRITPLSLDTILIGKAWAVFLKAMLVLLQLLPILAAAQLFGGVAAGDIAKSFTLTVAACFFCTALGILVSAGAKSTVDRVLRSAEILFLWLIATGVLASAALVFRRGSPSSIWTMMAGASPIVAWVLHVEASLTWPDVVANFCIHGLGGLFFLAMASKSLARRVAAAEFAPSEPRMKTLFAAMHRFSLRKRIASRVTGQREWAGTLVGTEITQTSLAAVMLPLAAGLPQAVMFIIHLVSGSSYTRDYPAFICFTLGAGLITMLAVQSCATIAREKATHTAELLAVAPSGGADMIWWKGAALLVTQSLSMAMVVLFLFLAPVPGSSRAGQVATVFFGALALLLLLFALGVSFSLASKTSFQAVGFLLASVFVLAPVAMMALAVLEDSFGYFRGPDVRTGVRLLALIGGMTLVWLRNVFGGLAAVVLAAGVAMALAGAALLLPHSSLVHPGLLVFAPFDRILNITDVRGDYPMIVVIVGELILSGLLLSGCYLKFTKMFLSGVRSKN